MSASFPDTRPVHLQAGGGRTGGREGGACAAIDNGPGSRGWYLLVGDDHPSCRASAGRSLARPCFDKCSQCGFRDRSCRRCFSSPSPPLCVSVSVSVSASVTVTDTITRARSSMEIPRQRGTKTLLLDGIGVLALCVPNGRPAPARPPGRSRGAAGPFASCEGCSLFRPWNRSRHS